MGLEKLADKIDAVVMDYNGTLATAGELMSGVFERLKSLSKKYEIVIATSDTFRNAQDHLKGLALTVKIVNSGEQKKALVHELKSQNKKVVVIGNGRNDIEMFKEADLSVAVIGPEGAFARLIEHSTIVVTCADHAFDLLEDTRKIVATLRE